MKLSNLSKYRAHLMGIATIFITLCHTSFAFNGLLRQAYAVFIIYIMKSGVDIFLFLSGLGCYFSYAKQPKYLSFQHKRLVRIFIPYFIVIIPVIILEITIEGKSFLSAVYTESIFSFFISGCLNYWFVSAIILLYLLFPLIYNLVNKKFVYTSIVCLSIMLIVLLPFWNNLPIGIKEVNGIFISRIPTFIIGAYLGKIIYNNNPQRNKEDIVVNKYVVIAVFAISTSLIIVLKAGNELMNTFFDLRIIRILFLPFSVSFSIIFTHCLNRTNTSCKLNRFLPFFGSISYTMYLVFEKVLHFSSKAFLYKNSQGTINTPVSIIINISSIIVAVLLSVFIQKMSDQLSNKVFKVLNNNH